MPRRTSRRRSRRRSKKNTSGIAKKSNPRLWEKAKKKACSQGKLCKHSARKMQWATNWYKRNGGRYIGKRSPNNRLTKWGKEKWRTSSGKKSRGKRRYLPDKVWRSLSPAQKRKANRTKLAGYRRGRQYVKNPRSVRRVARRVRKSRRKSKRKSKRKSRRYKYNMNCEKGVHDPRNCIHPGFPCWDSRKSACFDKDGSTQLFDPISDILRPMSHLFNYLIRKSDLGEDESNQLYRMMNDYITTFIPIQNVILRGLDQGRYYDIQSYIKKIRDIGHQAIEQRHEISQDIINTIGRMG